TSLGVTLRRILIRLEKSRYVHCASRAKQFNRNLVVLFATDLSVGREFQHRNFGITGKTDRGRLALNTSINGRAIRNDNRSAGCFDHRVRLSRNNQAESLEMSRGLERSSKPHVKRIAAATTKLSKILKLSFGSYCPQHIGSILRSQPSSRAKSADTKADTGDTFVVLDGGLTRDCFAGRLQTELRPGQIQLYLFVFGVSDRDSIERNVAA